jgi:hypothetical protein
MAPGASMPAGGEEHEIGGGQAQVDDVEPLPGDALGEGGGELLTGGAHVAGDEDPLGAVGGHAEAGEGGTDGPPAELGVELVRGRCP